MATGLPATLRSLIDGRGAAASSPELSYPGKRPREAILRGQPPALSTLFDGGGENRLYCADNLLVLRSLLHDPGVAGKVRLVYIDPPFATRARYCSRALDPAYDDLRSGAGYVEHLRERLILLRELLADDGSIYLHLDEKMVFHMKIVMDEVFGATNFRNCIVRRKCNPKNYTRRTYGNVADYLLFYTRGDRFVFHRPVEAWTEERTREYRHVEPETGRRYMKVPIHAPGTRAGATGQPWRGKPPPPGKHWQYPPATLDEMDARGEIFWSANGNPRRKVYLDESAGVPVQDIWTDFRDAHNQNVGITGYPTEKNLQLLERIVRASSNEGDLVLDCYAGSGTTLAAASKLSRRWIGADDSLEALRTILQRFTRGTQLMGDFVGARKRRRREAAMPLFDRDGAAASVGSPHPLACRILAEPAQRAAVEAVIRAFPEVPA